MVRNGLDPSIAHRHGGLNQAHTIDSSANPRCVRMPSITKGSSITAMIFNLQPHVWQCSISMYIQLSIHSTMHASRVCTRPPTASPQSVIASSADGYTITIRSLAVLD